jgi:hypothetical protein
MHYYIFLIIILYFMIGGGFEGLKKESALLGLLLDNGFRVR